MPITATSVRDDIRHANDEFEACIERGDAAALAHLYTNSGTLLPTGMEAIQGMAGIQAFWEGALAQGVKEVKLRTRDLEELEHTAIELGTYTLYGENHQQLDQGKYLVVWKEQQGRWRLHQDIWNSSMPATA